MDKHDYEYKAYAAMTAYKNSKKRIEFLTVSISHKSEIDLMKTFLKLLNLMLYHSKYGRFLRIDYAGVMVNHQHIHCLIKKPFVTLEALSSDWDRLTGMHSDLTCKTVIQTPASVARLIRYIVNQGDEHETYDIIFFDSPDWGIVAKKSKGKKTEPKLKSIEISDEQWQLEHDKLLKEYEESSLKGSRGVLRGDPR